MDGEGHNQELPIHPGGNLARDLHGRQPAADYLALSRPTRRELMHAFVLMLVVQLVWFAVGWLIGQRASEFAIDSFRNPRDSGW